MFHSIIRNEDLAHKYTSGDSLTQGAYDQSRGFAFAAELQAGMMTLEHNLASSEGYYIIIISRY